MPLYWCQYCGRESPLRDDQVRSSVKCPHCGLLGIADGVNLRPDAPAAPVAPAAAPPAPAAEPIPERVAVRRAEHYEPPVAPTRTHPCAVLSLVCGLVGLLAAPFSLLLPCCCFPLPLLSLAAVVLGVVALVHIAAKRGRYTGKGMAVAGIVLGGIIVLSLAAMVLAGAVKGLT